MRRPLKRSLLRSVVAAALIAFLGTAALNAGATTSAWTLTTVASGLDAPRGVAILPNRTLLVAEAGHGGDVCMPDVDNGMPLTRCLGTTSRISSVNPATGARRTVVSGLFSMSGLGLTGADGQVMDQLLQRFTKEKGIKVDQQRIPWADLFAKLQVSVPAGEGPDQMLTQSPTIPGFATDVRARCTFN